MRTVIPPQFTGEDMQQLLTLVLTAAPASGGQPAVSAPPPAPPADPAPAPAEPPRPANDPWDEPW